MLHQKVNPNDGHIVYAYWHRRFRGCRKAHAELYIAKSSVMEVVTPRADALSEGRIQMTPSEIVLQRSLQTTK